MGRKFPLPWRPRGVGVTHGEFDCSMVAPLRSRPGRTDGQHLLIRWAQVTDAFDTGGAVLVKESVRDKDAVDASVRRPACARELTERRVKRTESVAKRAVCLSPKARTRLHRSHSSRLRVSSLPAR
eukprot:1733545-Prymnesium_polylepis.1